MTKIQAIRQKIIEREFYLSSHAEDEMADDNLERTDIENVILKEGLKKNSHKILEEQGIELRGHQKMEELFI